MKAPVLGAMKWTTVALWLCVWTAWAPCSVIMYILAGGLLILALSMLDLHRRWSKSTTESDKKDMATRHKVLWLQRFYIALFFLAIVLALLPSIMFLYYVLVVPATACFLIVLDKTLKSKNKPTHR